MRKHLIVSLCLVLPLISSAINAQQTESGQKRRYVIAPPESFLLVIAAQPDSPLRIENAKFLIGAEHGWGVRCQLRNQGTKPIRFLSLVAWTSYGAGGTLSPSGRSGTELIMPGQAVSCDEGSKGEIVPLTDDLRDKLKLRGSMQAVVVLMVVRIEFADGSVYSDEPAYKGLQDYFAEIASKVDRN
jgi:hypothetical protein